MLRIASTVNFQNIMKRKFSITNKNYFELFQVPAKFDINKQELKIKFNRLQLQYHPDKTNGAMIESSYINIAYSTLKDDIKRLQYLIHEYSGMSEIPEYKLDNIFILKYYDETESKDREELLQKIDKDKKELFEKIKKDLDQDVPNWFEINVNYTKIAFLHNFANRVQCE
jgi:molecular chaperone HscB